MFSGINTVTISLTEWTLLKERRESNMSLHRIIEDGKQQALHDKMLHDMAMKDQKVKTTFYKVLFYVALGLSISLIAINASHGIF